MSEDARAFLQHRVGNFGAAVAVIGGSFLLFRILMLFVTDHTEHLNDGSMVMHGVVVGIFAALWGLMRGRPFAPRTIKVLEGVFFVGGCAGYIYMGQFIPLGGRPEYILLLALCFIIIPRAIYVPSSGRHTLLLAAIIGLILVPVQGYRYLSLDLKTWAQVLPDLAHVAPQEVAISTATWVAAWWTCAAITAASASRVIYGLREEARDARKLGQYRLERKLGEGGMGVVYVAQHAMLRRPTAVKLLPPNKAGERAIERFEREVRHTAALDHPNTVNIYDYGRTPDGIFYYAMELIEGATLSELVRAAGPQPAARVLDILDQVSGALVEAHGVGLIHRDIKPQNIMLAPMTGFGAAGEITKVLDFGLVKELDNSQAVGLTQADVITGTPQYMSPEAIRDPESVGAASDLYALGAVAFLMLTGREVFEGSSVIEICGMHMHSAPVAPSTVASEAVSPELDALVLRCLAKSPGERFDDAAELRAELRRCPEYGQWRRVAATQWWADWSQRLEEARGEESGASLTIDIARFYQGDEVAPGPVLG